MNEFDPILRKLALLLQAEEMLSVLPVDGGSCNDNLRESRALLAAANELLDQVRGAA